MSVASRFRTLPGRAIAGGYILHAGIEKWGADEEHATALHGFASGTYPMLKDIPPAKFVRLLAGGEIALGSALIAPFIGNGPAGLGLSAFSAGLLGMYFQTPGMRKENSIWPSQSGIGISKDVFMLGIGLSLLLEAVTAGSKKS